MLSEFESESELSMETELTKRCQIECKGKYLGSLLIGSVANYELTSILPAELEQRLDDLTLIF